MTHACGRYVPDGVDGSALGARIAAAMPRARAAVISGAPHSLEGYTAEAVAEVVGFLSAIVAAAEPS